MIPTIAKDIFSSCLWTGVSVFTTELQEGVDKIRLDQDGVLIPAMPHDLFKDVNAVISTVQLLNMSSRGYYDQSMVKQYDISSVPPKVDIKKFTEFKDVYESKPHSLRNVKPKELIELNIGSNAGLLVILKRLYDNHQMNTDECERYITLNVDENIYYRILKVKYIYICIYMYVYVNIYISTNNLELHISNYSYTFITNFNLFYEFI